MGYKLSRNNVTVLVQAIEFIDDKSNQKIDIDVIKHELNRNKSNCNYSSLKFLLDNINTIDILNKRKLINNDIDVKTLKSKIDKSKEMSLSENGAPKTPDELLKVIDAFRKSPEYSYSETIMQILTDISYNLKQVETVNNVLGGEFVEDIKPILKLGMWKELKHFSDEDIVLIIIKVLGIMCKNDNCWQQQDEDDNFDYCYKMEISLIEFANKFFNSQYDDENRMNRKYKELYGDYTSRISDVIKIFEDFDYYICKNELSKELIDFLNDVNIPHAVLVLNKYHKLLAEQNIDPNKLQFLDILREFLVKKDDNYYIDDDYSSDFNYDRRYFVDYVNQRQEHIEGFFSDYIDEYIKEYNDN